MPGKGKSLSAPQQLKLEVEQHQATKDALSALEDKHRILTEKSLADKARLQELEKKFQDMTDYINEVKREALEEQKKDLVQQHNDAIEKLKAAHKEELETSHKELKRQHGLELQTAKINNDAQIAEEKIKIRETVTRELTPHFTEQISVLEAAKISLSSQLSAAHEETGKYVRLFDDVTFKHKRTKEHKERILAYLQTMLKYKQISRRYELVIRVFSVALFVKMYRHKKKMIAFNKALVNVVKIMHTSKELDDLEKKNTSQPETRAWLKKAETIFDTARSADEIAEHIADSVEVIRLGRIASREREQKWELTTQGFFQRNTLLAQGLKVATDKHKALKVRFTAMLVQFQTLQQKLARQNRSFDLNGSPASGFNLSPTADRVSGSFSPKRKKSSMIKASDVTASPVAKPSSSNKRGHGSPDSLFYKHTASSSNFVNTGPSSSSTYALEANNYRSPTGQNQTAYTKGVLCDRCKRFGAVTPPSCSPPTFPHYRSTPTPTRSNTARAQRLSASSTSPHPSPNFTNENSDSAVDNDITSNTKRKVDLDGGNKDENVKTPSGGRSRTAMGQRNTPRGTFNGPHSPSSPFERPGSRAMSRTSYRSTASPFYNIPQQPLGISTQSTELEAYRKFQRFHKATVASPPPSQTGKKIGSYSARATHKSSLKMGLPYMAECLRGEFMGLNKAKKSKSPRPARPDDPNNPQPVKSMPMPKTPPPSKRTLSRLAEPKSQSKSRSGSRVDSRPTTQQGNRSQSRVEVTESRKGAVSRFDRYSNVETGTSDLERLDVARSTTSLGERSTTSFGDRNGNWLETDEATPARGASKAFGADESSFTEPKKPGKVAFDTEPIPKIEPREFDVEEEDYSEDSEEDEYMHEFAGNAAAAANETAVVDSDTSGTESTADTEDAASRQTKDIADNNVAAQPTTDTSEEASSASTEVNKSGQWRAAIDQTTGNTYYFNDVTKETTWQRPSELIGNGEQMEASGSHGWIVATDNNSGRTYYYHPTTQKTTWERPAEMDIEADMDKLQDEDFDF